jgi:hypothetical protein
MNEGAAGSGQAGQSGGAAGGQGGQGGQAGAGSAGAAGGGQSWNVTAEVLGEHAANPVFKAFEGKPVGEVFKAYSNAQSLIGAKGIIEPTGKNDTPEYWNSVFDRLGRPKDAKGYNIPIDKTKLPEGLSINDKRLDGFREVAHQAGLLPKQVEAIFNWHMGEVQADYKGIQEQQGKAYEEGMAKLTQMYGGRTDEIVQTANKVLKQFGGTPQEIQDFAAKYGNDPGITSFLARVGVSMRESALVRGEKVSFDMDPKDAKSRKNDIMTNKQNPLNEAYFKKNHPRHAEAVDEVQRLNKQLAGG